MGNKKSEVKLVFWIKLHAFKEILRGDGAHKRLLLKKEKSPDAARYHTNYKQKILWIPKPHFLMFCFSMLVLIVSKHEHRITEYVATIIVLHLLAG